MGNAVRLLLAACAACVALGHSACLGRAPSDPAPPVALEEGDDDDGGESFNEDLIAISPTVQNFGTVGVGSTSAPVPFTVTNSSAASSQTGLLTTSTTGDFAVAESTCVASLGGGESCTFSVTFTPTQFGLRSGNVTVTAAALANSASAALSGTCADVDRVLITPSVANFGEVAVGEASSPQTFTLTNEGDDDTGALAVALGGGDPSQFVVVADACSAAPLTSGTSCDVTIEFRPTRFGAMAASFIVTDDSSNSVTASLSGTGLSKGGASLAVSPTSRNYGTVSVGSDSAELSFTMTNIGDVASGALTTSIDGADATSFFITSSTCDAVSLGPNESCVVGVTYSPANDGSNDGSNDNATLSVTATPGGTVTADLLGTPSAP